MLQFRVELCCIESNPGGCSNSYTGYYTLQAHKVRRSYIGNEGIQDRTVGGRPRILWVRHPLRLARCNACGSLQTPHTVTRHKPTGPCHGLA